MTGEQKTSNWRINAVPEFQNSIYEQHARKPDHPLIYADDAQFYHDLEHIDAFEVLKLHALGVDYIWYCYEKDGETYHRFPIEWCNVEVIDLDVEDVDSKKIYTIWGREYVCSRYTRHHIRFNRIWRD